MRLDLEEDLWRSLPLFDGYGITPRLWAAWQIHEGMIASEKQAIATLRKWGPLYECGTDELAGWRTTDVNPRLVRRRAEADRAAWRVMVLRSIGNPFA